MIQKLLPYTCRRASHSTVKQMQNKTSMASMVMLMLFVDFFRRCLPLARHKIFVSSPWAAAFAKTSNAIAVSNARLETIASRVPRERFGGSLTDNEGLKDIHVVFRK